MKIIDAMQTLYNFTGRPPTAGHLDRTRFDELVSSLDGIQFDVTPIPNQMGGPPYLFLRAELPGGGHFFAQRYADVNGSS